MFSLFKNNLEFSDILEIGYSSLRNGIPPNSKIVYTVYHYYCNKLLYNLDFKILR
jgi:hypothetical protein